MTASRPAYNDVVADALARIAKLIADPHPLAESDRPSGLRTVVGVVGPFIVLEAIIALVALLS